MLGGIVHFGANITHAIGEFLAGGVTVSFVYVVVWIRTRLLEGSSFVCKVQLPKQNLLFE